MMHNKNTYIYYEDSKNQTNSIFFWVLKKYQDLSVQKDLLDLVIISFIWVVDIEVVFRNS